METRKITVVSTRDQKRTTIETAATTLGELKEALRSANVDYTDMTFYEALTRTEYLQDSSVLPHDVPYKGTTTNELVFMLTNQNKKIRSGALSEVRTALYEEIVKRNLAQAILEEYGKNYTNCSNVELTSFLEKNVQEESSNCDMVARVAVRRLTQVLYDSDILTTYEAESIESILDSTPSPEKVESSYSEDELNDILEGMSDFVR